MYYRPNFFPLLLMLPLFAPAVLSAQDTRAQVKTAIHTALEDHLHDVFPPNNCEANDSGHHYSGEFNVTRSQEIQGTLRIWGKASVTYRNRRTGGRTAVEYYAECRKVNGDVIVTKLRWRRGPCMRFTSLLER